jgi:uncharacterized MAPEG superfamily protein
MTLAKLAVFGAVLLYLLTIAPVKPLSALSAKQFDNANPRNPAFYTPGMRSRALGAHLNGVETFPFFAAAVLLAEWRNGPQYWIDGLAMAFVVVRLAYVLTYLGNLPTLRTLLWNLGFLVNAAIFFMPWWWPRSVGLIPN